MVYEKLYKEIIGHKSSTLRDEVEVGIGRAPKFVDAICVTEKAAYTQENATAEDVGDLTDKTKAVASTKSQVFHDNAATANRESLTRNLKVPMAVGEEVGKVIERKEVELNVLKVEDDAIPGTSVDNSNKEATSRDTVEVNSSWFSNKSIAELKHLQKRMRLKDIHGPFRDNKRLSKQGMVTKCSAQKHYWILWEFLFLQIGLLFRKDGKHHHFITGHMKCKYLLISVRNMRKCEMPKNGIFSQVRVMKTNFFDFLESHLNDGNHQHMTTGHLKC